MFYWFNDIFVSIVWWWNIYLEGVLLFEIYSLNVYINFFLFFLESERI